LVTAGDDFLIVLEGASLKGNIALAEALGRTRESGENRSSSR
jgi:hypothetical protein